MISLFTAPQTVDETLLTELIKGKQSATSSFTRFCPERIHRLWFHEWSFYCVTKISTVLHKTLWQTHTYTTYPSHHPLFPHAIIVGNTPPDSCDPPEKETESGIELSYYVGKMLPLEYDQTITRPNTIDSVSDFFSLIKNKKTLFYTGAGISYGVVPTMQELIQSIQLDKEKDVDWLLLSVLTDPWELERRWRSFADRMRDAQPSPAHLALTRFCLDQNVQLFTENFDLLHQRAGIIPIIPEWPWFEKNLSLEEIRQIEYVVTVGLSEDDRGLLAYLRKHNPQIIIISINPNLVSYLGQQDIWFADDCQKILLF